MSDWVQKTRNINRLARVALEREEQVREYRVRSGDMGQFPASKHNQVAVAVRVQVWRQKFSGEPADSLGNFAVLRRVTHVIQSDYSSLQSTYSGPDRAMDGGRAGGEANGDGDRDAPREIGTGLDIRVDAHAERGDGDDQSRGVESVAATVARHCTGREPMSMASTAAATVTVELVSGGAARGSDTHSTVTVGGGVSCAGHSRSRQ